MSDRKPPETTTDQELTARVDALEAEVAAQGDAIVALTERVAALEDGEEITEPPPVIEPPPETGDEITTFQVKNTGGSDLTNPQVSLAHPLAPGAVAADQHIELQLEDGTVVPCQQDQESVWQDGSLKVPVLSFVHPGSIPAGAVVTYRLARQAGAPDRTPCVTLEDIAANSDFKMHFTGQTLGADVFRVSVNDIVADNNNWPWGTNPTQGYEVVRVGPVCCEWRFWSYLHRVGDDAWHKWLKGWIYVRAWGPTGPFEIAPGVRQSNATGPHPSGTVGASPEPHHVFDVQVMDGASIIQYWGGANDPRIMVIPATDFNPADNFINTPSPNDLTYRRYGGVAVTLSGAVGDGLGTDTVYWYSMGSPEGMPTTGALVAKRYDVNDGSGQVDFTTPGSGDITIIPHAHCYPFTGQMYINNEAMPHWVGGTRPTVAVAHNFEYLTQDALVFPAYQPGITVNDIGGSLFLKHSPGNQVIEWHINQGGQGSGDERIGYLEWSQGRALYNPFDVNNNQRCRVMAAAFAEQHIYLEDESSGVLIINNNGPAKDGTPYPDLGPCYPEGRCHPFASGGFLTPSEELIDKDGIYESYGHWLGGSSHCPLPGQIPYIQTGDDYWREYMMHVSQMNHAQTYWDHKITTVGGTTYYDILHDQGRGIAWGMRHTGQANHFMPAAHPLSQYFKDRVNDNGDYHWAWSQAPLPPLASGAPDRSGVSPNYRVMGSGIWESGTSFQENFIMISFGMEALRNPSGGFASFINNHYAKRVIGRFDPSFGLEGCLYTIGQRNLYMWAPNDPIEPRRDTVMLTNWNDIYINCGAYEGPGSALYEWSGCPPSGLINLAPAEPPPHGVTSMDTLSTCALAMWSRLNGGAAATALFSEVRARQDVFQGGTMSHTDYPQWSICPIGWTG